MTTLFDDLALLVEACHEARRALDKAREVLTEDDFDDLLDGPAADIVAAAMDVEYYLEKCDGL